MPIAWSPFDSHSPSIPIINYSWQDLSTASSVSIELMYVNLCRLTNTGVFIYRSPFISLTVPRMSCSSYLDDLWDGRQVAVECCFQDLFKTEHTHYHRREMESVTQVEILAVSISLYANALGKLSILPSAMSRADRVI